jgi:hypothetical protein
MTKTQTKIFLSKINGRDMHNYVESPKSESQVNVQPKGFKCVTLTYYLWGNSCDRQMYN